MDREFEYVLSLLPNELQMCKNAVKTDTFNVTEIRIRTDKLITFTVKGTQISSRVMTDKQTVESIFVRLCGNSVFAHHEEIKRGYITLKGGIRVGICGRAVFDNTGITNICDISGINIRIARHIQGVSNGLMPYILTENGINNILILGPPLSGKTTVLRDIICELSRRDMKVSVIDERGELSIIQKDCQNADFFIGYPRQIAIEQAVRCFSPDVIVFDELGNTDDIGGLYNAIDTGVAVITTAHGDSLTSLKQRKLLKSALEESIFNVAVLLDTKENIGKIKKIYTLNKGSEAL